MSEPQIIGKDLNLGPPPKVKVVLVKEEMQELEDELTKGWKIAAAYGHSLGALFLLMK